MRREAKRENGGFLDRNRDLIIHPSHRLPSTAADASFVSPAAQFGGGGGVSGGATNAAAPELTVHCAPSIAFPAPPPPSSSAVQKRALIVGCNYRGTPHALKGCINDAKCLAYCLQTRFGFKAEDCVLMTDDSPDRALWPTRQNILTGMTRMVSGVRAGDRLVFSFSGHGSQTQDWSGDEADGFNETLCPCDFKASGAGGTLGALFGGGGGGSTAGMIVDDEINALLVNSLPEGVHLHAIIDACHSGSVLDLEFRTEMTPRGASWAAEYGPRGPKVKKSTSGGLAIQFGSSRDSQTSADTAALSGTVSTGAATWAFINSIEKLGTGVSYGRLLDEMHATLHKALGAAGAGGGGVPGMPELPGLLGLLLGVGMQMAGGPGGAGGGVQNPVLSASQPFDLNTPLMLG